MAVALQSPLRSRERILLIGGPKVGKSEAVLSIARKINGTMRVMDNDRSYERLLETRFKDVNNVEVYEIDNWDDYLLAINGIKADLKPDDWSCIDMVSKTWDDVQADFSDKIMGQNIGDYFMQVRAKMDAADRSLKAYEGFTDWAVINKVYAETISKFVLNVEGHVICTAEVETIGEKEKDRDTLRVFGPYGVKPKGQKRLGHLFQTILYLTKRSKGEYYMTTIGDRGRDDVVDEELKDFASDYLMKVAGWKMKKVDEGKDN